MRVQWRQVRKIFTNWSYTWPSTVHSTKSLQKQRLYFQPNQENMPNLSEQRCISLQTEKSWILSYADVDLSISRCCCLPWVWYLVAFFQENENRETQPTNKLHYLHTIHAKLVVHYKICLLELVSCVIYNYEQYSRDQDYYSTQVSLQLDPDTINDASRFQNHHESIFLCYFLIKADLRTLAWFHV